MKTRPVTEGDRLAAFQAFEAAIRAGYAALVVLGEGPSVDKASSLLGRARMVVSCLANCGERK